MDAGLFITFEGIDGVGKTTQAILLQQYLNEQGKDVVHTHEPGGTRLGQQIRELLLNPNHNDLQSITEILLYAADRAQHVEEVIRPALTEGKVVICERFIDSSIAYQGFGLGMDIDTIESINHWATGGLVPELTIYLDADPVSSLTRTKGDRIEQRTVEYYERVRKGFLQIAQSDDRRFKVVSAIGTKQEVAQRVYQALAGRLA